MIEAIAYLESWGDAKAESPAGPRGIMQISEATAHTMGLKVVHATRYQRDQAKRCSVAQHRAASPSTRPSPTRCPTSSRCATTACRPDRAIPAAARYLAGMEQKFGGRDWAIFAYHCGAGLREPK